MIKFKKMKNVKKSQLNLEVFNFIKDLLVLMQSLYICQIFHLLILIIRSIKMIFYYKKFPLEIIVVKRLKKLIKWKKSQILNLFKKS